MLMMGIWNLITRNLTRRPHTRQPETWVPFPSGFRGELFHDAALCTACGTCTYVCSPAAIELDRSLPDGVAWQYQSMQCTHCGRCVEHCPTHALSFGTQPQPLLHELQITRHTVTYQPCSRCGEPVIPLPHAVLAEKYGSPVPQDVERLNGLCERCRQKVYSANIKRSFTGR
jgi:ferredoxin